MKNVLCLSAAAAALVFAAPAAAQTFIDVGDGYIYNFDGTQADTSAELTLTLAGVNMTNTMYDFSYVLTNTSTGDNDMSRVRSLAFDVNGDLNEPLVSVMPTNSNGFDSVAFGANIPDGHGPRDVCFFRGMGSCIGGGAGVGVGESATGSFTLAFLDPVVMLTLSELVVRYQATGIDGEGSGTGVPTSVSVIPEPATWAMMIAGFGVIGGAMRRRATRTTLAYA